MSFDEDWQHELDRRALRDYLGWPDPEPNEGLTPFAVILALVVAFIPLVLFIALGLVFR